MNATHESRVSRITRWVKETWTELLNANRALLELRSGVTDLGQQTSRRNGRVTERDSRSARQETGAASSRSGAHGQAVAGAHRVTKRHRTDMSKSSLKA